LPVTRAHTHTRRVGRFCNSSDLGLVKRELAGGSCTGLRPGFFSFFLYIWLVVGVMGGVSAGAWGLAVSAHACAVHRELVTPGGPAPGLRRGGMLVQVAGPKQVLPTDFLPTSCTFLHQHPLKKVQQQPLYIVLREVVLSAPLLLLPTRAPTCLTLSASASAENPMVKNEETMRSPSQTTCNARRLRSPWWEGR
jgi:hypothetical protein